MSAPMCAVCDGQGEVQDPAQAGRPTPPEHVRTVQCTACLGYGVAETGRAAA